MKLLEPIVFWQTQQQKHPSCHCLPLYSIFFEPVVGVFGMISLAETISSLTKGDFHELDVEKRRSKNSPALKGFLQPSQRVAKVTS